MVHVGGDPGFIPWTNLVDATLDESAPRRGGTTTAASLGASAAALLPFRNLMDYGAVGDGVTNDTAAVQAWIDDCLEDIVQAGLAAQDTAFACAGYAPPGRYLISGEITGDKPAGLAADPILVNDITFHISAYGATFCQPDGSTNTMFTFHGMRLIVDGARFQGSLSNTGCMFQLGNDAQTIPLYQSTFRNCFFYGGGTGTNLAWAYDVAFYDCIWSSTPAGGVQLEMPTHPTDSCNNIQFFRCHFEPASTAAEALVKIVNNGTGARIHHDIGFHGCHWETHVWGPVHVWAENVNGLTFTGSTQFTASGDLGGLAADAAPILRLIDCNVVNLYGAQIGRAVGSAGDKVIELGGSTTMVAMFGCYIFTGDSGFTKNSIWQNASGDPITVQDTPIAMYHCNIDGFGGAPRGEEITAWTPPDNFDRWTARVDAGAGPLVFGYNNNQASYSTSRVDKFKLEQDGTVGLLAGALSGLQSTIADNATGTFTIGSTNNSNRRGIYAVTANGPNSYYALFFSDGTNLAAISTGSGTTANNTNLATATKLNVFISAGGVISVNNLTGGSLIVNCVCIAGFRA